MLNTAMVNRQQNKIEYVAKRTDSIALELNEVQNKLRKQRVNMSTDIDLSELSVSGGGSEDNPYHFILSATLYSNVCEQLVDLFNNHKGNSFDDVEMNTTFSVGNIAYAIESDRNYIGYFKIGTDSETDSVDGVDAFKDASFISIDAIPIGNSATAILGGGQPTISFALGKTGELWTAVQPDLVTLIKQDQNGVWYDCFIRPGEDGNIALTSAVPWMPETEESVSDLHITYTINGTNFN